MRGNIWELSDRRSIAAMWEANRHIEDIAADFGVSCTRIYREINRGNTNGERDHNMRYKYDPELAQLRYYQAYSKRGRPRKTPAVAQPAQSAEVTEV